MSFLAPLFLAGAAAIALPFLFHLIRRSTRDKVVFSSLMFLEASPPKVTKRSRLEHILLLLLRCAILCLLAFVFARPFLPRPMAAAAGPEQNARVAIVVDASASMRRENLWNQAKERALGAVRALKPSESFAVYTFDQQLRTVLNFSEAAQLPAGDRSAAVQSRLGAIEPSWAGTHLGNAFLQATEHLLEELNRDSKEQGAVTLRLVVVSDFQNGARLEGLQGFEWPKGIEVQLEQLRANEVSNAGLQVLEEMRNPFAATTNAPVRVRVSNATGSKVEQFEVQWRRGGVEPLGEKISVYVPAGQSRIAIAPQKPEGATVLMLTGDKVEFDNLGYAVQPKRDPILIGYHGLDNPGDPQQMRYYVQRAFEQTNLATRVLALSNNIPSMAQAPSQDLSLLILGTTPNDEVIALAKSMLAAGRTVLLPLRDPASANAISQLTGFLATAPEAQPGTFGMFGRIDFQNPLFAPFSDARFSDFTKIHFWKYRALDLSNITNANVIASFDSGQPLLTEIPVEKGRLLVLASTWIPADSQLALSSKFVPLLFGILEQSAQLSSMAHQYVVGETVSIAEGTTEIVLPNGEKSSVESTRFGETLTPGVYAAGTHQFAINVDPNETRIAPLQLDELRALGIPLGATEDVGSETAAAEKKRNLLASETEARQKLWRNFLLFALALVLIESWLSGRLSRSPTAPAAA